MNIWDILIVALIAAAVGFAFYSIKKQKRAGKCSCGSCSGCAGCGTKKG